ncbi:MAG TPA: DUF4089 domain-containing protein [Casimicrobiaceae bacterium]
MTFDPHAYLDAASAAIDLDVPRDRRDAVAANLARLFALAHEVLEFALPPDSPSRDPDA